MADGQKKCETSANRVDDRMLDLVRAGRRRARKPAIIRRTTSACRSAALINHQVLLLDEPLGAIGSQIAPANAVELKASRRRVGDHVYFVTDQEEALTMSDRILAGLQPR